MFLGIEIGGTKLQIGVGRGDGTLAEPWRATIIPALGSAGIRKLIEQGIPQSLVKANVDRTQLRGVGVGFGGPVDVNTQTVIKSHQIEGWNSFPLAQWITELCGLPCVVGNDADVAGLAESLHGAGRGCNPVFYVTIGSGIGGGLIINGKIHNGVGKGAAEIGHLPTTIPGLVLEQVASGWGIQSIAQEKLRNGALSSALQYCGGVIEDLRTHHLSMAAQNGDPFARQSIQDAVEHLARALDVVIRLICPQRIVLGGGVSLMPDSLLMLPLREQLAKICFAPFAGLTDVMTAELGESVVIHGALALAKARFDE